MIEQCDALREFLLSNYAAIKAANPGFPMLVRECAGTEAKLIARYGERMIHPLCSHPALDHLFRDLPPLGLPMRPAKAPLGLILSPCAIGASLGRLQSTSWVTCRMMAPGGHVDLPLGAASLP